MNYPSKYISADMTPIPMPEEWKTRTRDEWRDMVTGFNESKQPYKIPLKISYLYPTSNGPEDVQMEKEEVEFETVEDAILFLQGLEEEIEKREAEKEVLED